MSNFICEKCGAAIIEDESGQHMTGCDHYNVDSHHLWQAEIEREEVKDNWLYGSLFTLLFIVLVAIALWT